jgi:NOL1/NOP2/sun family putative RNA methylase
MPEKIEFKDKFINRYKDLTDWDEFKRVSLTFLRRSIRINTLKKSVEPVKKSLFEQGWHLTQIPWCKEGFWVEHEKGRRDIGNTAEHRLGYFYIQEAASMIPPLALEPKPGETVLDMCASPGSKTTQIAQMMQNKGILISNDYKGDRLAPLGLNSHRMGLTNQIITLNGGQKIKDIKFDRILVDAPCSGTGTIRKSLKPLRIWNPNMIKRLAHTQKKLIENAYTLLKPVGTLVYSTCSLEPEEDEGVVDHMLQKYEDLKTVPIKLDGLKVSKPVMEFDGKQYSDQVKNCIRLWPQDNDTEGFFVAKLLKKK